MSLKIIYRVYLKGISLDEVIGCSLMMPYIYDVASSVPIKVDSGPQTDLFTPASGRKKQQHSPPPFFFAGGSKKELMLKKQEIGKSLSKSQLLLLRGEKIITIIVTQNKELQAVKRLSVYSNLDHLGKFTHKRKRRGKENCHNHIKQNSCRNCILGHAQRKQS